MQLPICLPTIYDQYRHFWMATDIEDETALLHDPLLEKHDSDSNEALLLNGECTPISKTKRLLWLYPYLFHAIFFIIYTTIFAFCLRTTGNSSSRQIELLPCKSKSSYSIKAPVSNEVKVPARSSLEWETKRLTINIVNNSYSGKPRSELDEAWHNLLQRG